MIKSRKLIINIMKSLFKKLFILIAVILSVSFVTSLTAKTNTYAYGNNCSYFLNMPSWDCGVSENVNSTEVLTNNIWLIAANVFSALTQIASYLVLGFIVYGGYQYIFSGGDAGKLASGKKTLFHAFIGLVIVLSVNVILTAIRAAFMNNQPLNACQIDVDTGGAILSKGCITSKDVVINALQWFIGTAGAIAFVFVVIGAIGYITSAGDAGKLQKSKNTIIYALVGIIIVALAELILGFFEETAKNAQPTSQYNQTLIAKEIYEE